MTFNVSTSQVSLAFDAVRNGPFQLNAIRDVVTQRAWWHRSGGGSGMLFEFARGTIDRFGVVSSGPARQSDTGLVVRSIDDTSYGCYVEAEAPLDHLWFTIRISRKSRHDAAVLVSLDIHTKSADHVFLRLVLPRLSASTRSTESSWAAFRRHSVPCRRCGRGQSSE